MKELSDTELPDPENDTVRSMRYSQPSVLSDLNDLSLAIVALQLVRVDPAKSTRVVVAVCLTHARLLLISKASNAINPNRTRQIELGPCQNTGPIEQWVYRSFLEGLEKNEKDAGMTREIIQTLVISYFST
jgi:hypothetical protein